MTSYSRYEIPTRPVPNIAPHPGRFNVEVSRVGLAKLLLREVIQFRGNLPVVLSRPCVYGVFSGPLGGFFPREEKCVGCLRCTVQYPDFVRVLPNPARLNLGDTFFTPGQVDTVLYEAATGRLPVRGAGYRGAFGGEGWDGMWTDMSEIVRPTRDGIHGREFISTSVDLGSRPAYLTFASDGVPSGETPEEVSLPVPMMFDRLPLGIESHRTYAALARAAERLQCVTFMPLTWILRLNLDPEFSAPIVEPGELSGLDGLRSPPRIVELQGWERTAFEELRSKFPHTPIFIRLPFGEDIHPALEAGATQFHAVADYHGQTKAGFVLDAIQALHEDLVGQGVREQVSLVGSGGIVAAEHVPKAIICGLDAVALDSPVWIAWQGSMLAECTSSELAAIDLPEFDVEWGSQRLVNFVGAWRDQLLEILGAMGLREVRRLRGEIGRAMFQSDLEHEAFSEIAGFES